METVNKILFAIPSLNSARIYAFVLRLANEFSYETRTNKAQPKYEVACFQTVLRGKFLCRVSMRIFS